MNDLSLYYKHQKDIRTGDHIGWRSDGIIGHLIRWCTTDSINHSSMAIRLQYEGLDKRRFDMGALNRGMEFHLLSKLLRNYNGHVWWYPLKDDYGDLRPVFARRAFTILDTKYDYGSLFKNVLGRVSTNAEKFFCSEAWNWIVAGAGVNTGFPISNKAPTPADIDGEMMHLFKDKIQIL